MAVATAAVVATAATVASTAYSMSQSSGGPSSLADAGYIGPGLNERLFNRGTREILDAERLILDDAIAQGKLLEPEMYRALGLEPVYDRPEDPEVASLSEQLSGNQARLNEIRQEQSALKASQPAKGLKGKAKAQAKKGKAQALKALKRESIELRKNVAAQTADLEQRGAVGRRVVGFKPIGGVADPTGSAGNAFGGALDQFNAHLANALSGKEPLDPTLKTTFDERERNLRERLRRQMGPDYESSTAGAQALANFDREKSEAFAQYNTNAIGYYSQLAESRAGSLQDLTTGRLKNLMIPSTFRSNLASELSRTAQTRLEYTRTAQGERAAKGQAQARVAEARAAEEQARAQQMSQLLSGVASAAPTAGSAVQGFVSPAAQPSTVSIPQYDGGGQSATARALFGR